MARIDEIVALENELKDKKDQLKKLEFHRGQRENDRAELLRRAERLDQDLELSADHMRTVMGREVIELHSYSQARDLLGVAEDNRQDVKNKLASMATEITLLDASKIPQARAEIEVLERQLASYGRLVDFRA